MAGHFCINCGVALEPVVLEGRQLEGCRRCDFVLWRDPKVVTMVVIANQEGELVLGRRAIEPGFGRWCLPGGFVNDDESPAESAARECLEEIGAEVQIGALLGVYHIRKAGAPSMVGIGFRGSLRPEAEPRPGPEMLEVRAFPAGELPELAFPSHQQAVTDWLGSGEGYLVRLPN